MSAAVAKMYAGLKANITKVAGSCYNISAICILCKCETFDEAIGTLSSHNLLLLFFFLLMRTIKDKCIEDGKFYEILMADSCFLFGKGTLEKFGDLDFKIFVKFVKKMLESHVDLVAKSACVNRNQVSYIDVQRRPFQELIIKSLVCNNIQNRRLMRSAISDYCAQNSCEFLIDALASYLAKVNFRYFFFLRLH